MVVPVLDREDVDLLGIRLGVPSSVLSRDRFDPCRLGGLLPVLLGGLLLFRLPGKLPPEAMLDRVLTVDEDGFLSGVLE